MKKGQHKRLDKTMKKKSDLHMVKRWKLAKMATFWGTH